MPGSIILVGDKAIHQALATMEVKLQKKAIRKSLRETTKYVQQDAKQLAPKTTGTLQRALRVRTVAKRGGTRAQRKKLGAAVVTSRVWFKSEKYYHPFVELGTRQKQSRRHLRKALFENQRWVRDYFKDELRRQIAEIARATRTKSNNERA